MQTRQKLTGIAIIEILATLIMAGTDAKFHNCCTKVSRAELQDPITGYRIQRWDPPCVQAVIFETEEGEVCIHLKQAWVLRKIRHFERSRRKISPTSSVPQYSTRTIGSTRQLTTSSQSFTGTAISLKGQTAELISPINELTTDTLQPHN